MATATYPGHSAPASARARIFQNGRALVQSSTQDLGTGTYTIMTQLAAEARRTEAHAKGFKRFGPDAYQAQRQPGRAY